MRLIDADKLCFSCTYTGDCMADKVECDKCEYFVISKQDITDAVITQNEWISCEDRLPEKKGDYLVTYLSEGMPVVGISTFTLKSGFILLYVIAWQELAMPYKAPTNNKCRDCKDEDCINCEYAKFILRGKRR